MNKNEFLQKLKEDLSSLTDEERMNALKYYEEYFADAGHDKEEEIITEFVSPEDLAEKIRQEMTGKDENKDIKYDNIFSMEPPAAPEPPKLVLEDEIEEIKIEIEKEIEIKKEKEVTKPQEPKKYTTNYNANKSNSSNDNALKLILLVCTFPIWLPLIIALGSAAFGIFMGIMGISFGVAAVAVAGFIMVGAGFISIGYGIVNIFFDFFNSFQWIGAGLVTAGAGMILAYIFTKLSGFMFKSQFKIVSKTIKGITNKFSHNNA